MTAEATTKRINYFTITIFDRCHNYIQTKAVSLMKFRWKTGGAQIVRQLFQLIALSATFAGTDRLQYLIFFVYLQVLICMRSFSLGWVNENQSTVYFSTMNMPLRKVPDLVSCSNGFAQWNSKTCLCLTSPKCEYIIGNQGRFHIRYNWSFLCVCVCVLMLHTLIFDYKCQKTVRMLYKM